MPDVKYYKKVSLSGDFRDRLFNLMQNLHKLGVELNSAEVLQTLKDLVKRYEYASSEIESLDRRSHLISRYLDAKLNNSVNQDFGFFVIKTNHIFYLQPVAMIGLKRKEYNLAKAGKLEFLPYSIDYAEYAEEV